MYLTGSNEPDAWVDITETFDQKIQALREHRSQIGDWAEMEGFVRERAADMGKGQGIALAEGFKYFRLRE